MERLPKAWETVLKLEPGWKVQLRKPHPCGNDWWVVLRLGADLRLQCTKCGRRVLLPRRKVAQRLKQAVPPTKEEEEEEEDET